MPIYEYQCQACQHTLEALQKLSEAPLTDCPACKGKSSLKRLVSAAGFQLKGTGWYATDFRNSGKPKTEPPPAAQATAKDNAKGKGETTPVTPSTDTKTGKAGTET